jgi:hypothetical protein
MAADDQLVASNMKQLAKNVAHLEFIAPQFDIHEITRLILKPILMQEHVEELTVTEITVHPKAGDGNLKYCKTELEKFKIPVTVSRKDDDYIEIKILRTKSKE